MTPTRSQRIHVSLPAELLDEIDRRFGKRNRSRFLKEVLTKEMIRLRQLEALDKAVGCWKDEDHPELKGGAAKWVEKLRQEAEERFRRETER